ncbi:hypothetical protein RF11_06043 [Thelohanellus kitauei]|uniref:Uncharacterized protein n=1 Tax=Thelohanellus kitauei TaxID=669202 RepID=A0A0C2J3J3_THEKT|nr:hypothetical protein RF11_06043 [Thelohanellus kitauei]
MHKINLTPSVQIFVSTTVLGGVHTASVHFCTDFTSTAMSTLLNAGLTSTKHYPPFLCIVDLCYQISIRSLGLSRLGHVCNRFLQLNCTLLSYNSVYTTAIYGKLSISELRVDSSRMVTSMRSRERFNDVLTSSYKDI